MDNGRQQEQFDGADAFTRMWTEMGMKMAEAGASFSRDASPPDTARLMRDTFLKAMGEYCEQFMRSPQFLEAMKQSMAASIGFRKQMNEFLGQMQHEFQGTSRQDVDQIMLSIRHVEQRMVDGMERLSDRLDGLAERLDTAAPTKKARPSKPSAKPSANKKKTIRKRSARKKSR